MIFIGIRNTITTIDLQENTLKSYWIFYTSMYSQFFRFLSFIFNENFFQFQKSSTLTQVLILQPNGELFIHTSKRQAFLFLYHLFFIQKFRRLVNVLDQWNHTSAKFLVSLCIMLSFYPCGFSRLMIYIIYSLK